MNIERETQNKVTWTGVSENGRHRFELTVWGGKSGSLRVAHTQGFSAGNTLLLELDEAKDLYEYLRELRNQGAI